MDVPHPDRGARVLQNLFEVDSSKTRQDRSQHYSNESNESLARVVGRDRGTSRGWVLCNGDPDSEEDERSPSRRTRDQDKGGGGEGGREGYTVTKIISFSKG